MQKISFTKEYTVEGEQPRDPSHFAHLVRKTSELIKRPYMQTFKMIEDWPMWKIESRLKACKGVENPARLWFGLRKKHDK